MKDWKGNEIKVGHTIIKVAIDNMFSGSKMCLIVNGEIASTIDIEKEYLWDIVGKCHVKEDDDNEIALGEVSEMGIKFLGFFMSVQPWEIICIEGISDNKEEFYDNYFKVS